MIMSKLPQRFALVGVLVGFGWMGLYWFDYNYNPFHLPPPPPLYNLLEKLMFVLCPGLILQIFTIGTSDRLGWVMWVLAAFLNAPVYYLVGFLFMSITRRGSRASAR